MKTSRIKVLEIDLNTEKINVHHREDLEVYLGGTGVAVKLFSEMVDASLPLLHPAQPIVLANGPLSTIFPVVTKVVAVFRSPLTGEYGESHAGMRLALAMRGAGYQAIVIRGQSRRPTYLSIGPNGVEFRNASALWGLGEGVGSILRRLVPGTGHRSTMKIGPAGEKMVAFASVSVDTYRHFGRLGLGAVFGAKNLKAVVVYGDRNQPIEDFKSYKKVYEEIYEKVRKTTIMKKYHDLGTPANVLNLHASGGLPIKNLQENKLPGVEGISGEAFAKDSLMRQVACSGCPIGCIHIGMHRTRFGEEYEFQSHFLSYDYELIFALGSFVGITTQTMLYDLIEKVEDLGLDAMSAGVCLGWVTEAFSRGLISETETGVAVSFGDAPGYLQVLDNIVIQPNDFYKVLAQGVEKAAMIYGGLDFAMTLGNHEMAGYHTGPAHLVGQTIGMRHSHLDNGGYGIDQKFPGLPAAAVVDKLVAEEKWRGVLTSLCICLFAREVYTPETVIAALAAVGITMGQTDLDELGERIYRLRQELRVSLGFKLENLRFAERFFQTPSASGKIDPAMIQAMIESYRRFMPPAADPVAVKDPVALRDLLATDSVGDDGPLA